MENLFPQTYLKDFHDNSAVSKMPYCVLGKTGLSVSHLSLGTSQLALCHGTEDELQGIETVTKAVKCGINYIDCAPFYGETKAEQVLGKALSLLPRQTYYIATKVGRYSYDTPKMFDFSAQRTFQSVDESLQRFNLEFVDVIQVHDIEFAPDLNVIINETLPALQKVKESGKAKFIGITGYPVEALKRLLELSSVDIDLVLSYCRCTLFDDTLKTFIPYFKEKGVGIISAAALGMGLLTNFGPPCWHPAKQKTKVVCSEAVQYCKQNGVDIARLAVSHALEQPGIDTHLIGMSRPHLLQENLDVLLNGLTVREKRVLETVKQRYFQPLAEKHWENIEIEQYWERQGGRPSDKEKIQK